MYIKEKDGANAIPLLTQAQDNIDLQGESQQEASILSKPQIYFYLGQAHELEKDLKRGLYNYKKCLQLDQGHFGACVYLANLLANLGEKSRAIKYYNHALKIDMNSVSANFGIGKVYYQYADGDLEEDKEKALVHF